MTNPSIASDLIERLTGDEINGGLVRDACWTAWSRANDGGDWSNDTLPMVQKVNVEIKQALSQLTREVEAYREALTASGETKAEYIGEFSFDLPVGFDRHGNDLHRSFDVPWTTIKEIMAAIRKRALSRSSGRVSDAE